eukprot:6469879-Amphidinium_carterae.1
MVIKAKPQHAISGDQREHKTCNIWSAGAQVYSQQFLLSYSLFDLWLLLEAHCANVRLVFVSGCQLVESELLPATLRETIVLCQEDFMKEGDIMWFKTGDIGSWSKVTNGPHNQKQIGLESVLINNNLLLTVINNY